MMSLIVWILIIFSVQGIGAASTYPKIATWYAGIQKPSWTPPSQVFGPVWTVLYLLMAISVWMIWRRRNQPGAARAILLFVFQLVLNSLWSLLFFGLGRIDWALADIVSLFLFIALSILAFRPISKIAAWLLLPYLLWVGFAMCLNFALWRLNP